MSSGELPGGAAQQSFRQTGFLQQLSVCRQKGGSEEAEQEPGAPALYLMSTRLTARTKKAGQRVFTEIFFLYYDLILLCFPAFID